MLANTLLYDHLSVECPHIHNSRLQSVMDVACSLQKGKRLSLTSLGRNINSAAKIKHRIKKVDRLEGNKHLHNELEDIYQGLSKYVLKYIGKNTTMDPVVIDLCYMQDCQEVQMLSAEMAVKGRTLPLYREVFKKNELKGRAASFLSNVFKCLPEDRQVLIIMDAGFGEDWFKAIEALNGYWLVRARKGRSIKIGESGEWMTIKDFIPLIGEKAKNHANCFLSKQYKRPCRIITKKQFSGKKRKKAAKPVKHCTTSRNSYSASAREPWILAANLPAEYKTTQVINYYKKRMQIEESFRDVKSHQFGLGARYAKTTCVYRWAVKMLLAAIVQITLWLIGVIGHSQGFQKVFQANTVNDKKVFSYFFLGQLIVEHDRLDELIIDEENISLIIDNELVKAW